MSVEPSTLALRALLFVPASEERKLAKLPELNADAVIVDLEDGVAESRKQEARQLAARWLPKASPRSLVVVRVNSQPAMMTLDLKVIVGPSLQAVMLPKLESEDQLRDLDQRLGILERERSLAPGSVAILGLIETARGVVACDAIAATASPRLLTFCLGPADLSADLRLPPSATEEALLYARSRVVMAARAGGMVGAIDGPYPSVKDLDGFRLDSARSRGLGFQGRLVLHPDHVQSAREAYSGLSAGELDFAARVVAAFSDHRQRGMGVIRVDDMVIDEPVYQRYRKILDQHQPAEASAGLGSVRG